MEGSCSKKYLKFSTQEFKTVYPPRPKTEFGFKSKVMEEQLSSSSSVLPCSFLLPKPLTVTKGFRLHLGYLTIYKAWIWCEKQFLSANPSIHSCTLIKALYQQLAISLTSKRLNSAAKCDLCQLCFLSLRFYQSPA